jgi:hypothetical protein
LATSSRLDEAVALVQLYHIVNPEAESLNAKYESGLEHNFVQVMLFLWYKSRLIFIFQSLRCGLCKAVSMYID